ncbi:hypothetical protein [Zunongwangia sp.]|uniref:hypothetical protein n=1 Tax=Zunongwangia sp. TaxID=1965325 RepID=UPI003AA9B0E5
MKKLSLFLFVLLNTTFLFAQFEKRGNYIITSDSVGIGIRPRAKLEVRGGTKLGFSLFSSVESSSANGWLRDTWLYAKDGLKWNENNKVWQRGAYLYNDFGGIIWDDGGTYFIRENRGDKLNFTNEEFLETAFLFANIATGYVGIGTIHPDARLSVNGTVHSNEVKVDTKEWADVVFRDEYSLPTLKEIEKFITENRHLEHIPTEKEVVKNGVEVGVMLKLLLQKVEELTLYTIEQQKEIEKLKKQNNNTL